MSPYSISDPLVRAGLYREIRQGANDWPQYTIKPDELLMPELTAFRHYGNSELKWVVLVAAGLDNMRGELTAGQVVKLPPPIWIRQRIKYYESKVK
jgi:hypothetical protein